MKNTGLLAPQYQEEEAARKHLESVRWPDGAVCPHCGVVGEATKLEPREGSKSPVRKGVYQCNGCREQFTVTVGTIFEDSHIPLHKWLLAIHLMCSSKKGISAHQLMRNLSLGSYRTAWFMAHRIRWALTQEPVKATLNGILEVDETYVGGKLRVGSYAPKLGERPKDRPAPSANKAAVLSVLQRRGCRSLALCRARDCEKHQADHRRDGLEGCAPDDRLFQRPYRVSERPEAFACESQRGRVRSHRGGTLISTNTVEGYFAILKRGNYGVYHHWSKKYMPQYLREFDWRYNFRSLSDGERVPIVLRKPEGKRLLLKPSTQKV